MTNRKVYKAQHRPTEVNAQIAPQDDVIHTSRGRIFIKGNYDVRLWDDSGEVWANNPEEFLKRYEGPDELIDAVQAIIERGTK